MAINFKTLAYAIEFSGSLCAPADVREIALAADAIFTYPAFATRDDVGAVFTVAINDCVTPYTAAAVEAAYRSAVA